MNCDDVEMGMRVKIIKLRDYAKAMMVKPEYLENRQVGAAGVVRGYVEGHGGDAYWVRHDDGKIALYVFDEFEPEEAGGNCKMAETKLTKINDHPYGWHHDLIGKPCLYKNNGYAVPFGARKINSEFSLAVAYRPTGRDKVKIILDVSPADLQSLDADTVEAKRIYHLVLAGLIEASGFIILP